MPAAGWVLPSVGFGGVLAVSALGANSGRWSGAPLPKRLAVVVGWGGVILEAVARPRYSHKGLWEDEVGPRYLGRGLPGDGAMAVSQAPNQQPPGFQCPDPRRPVFGARGWPPPGSCRAAGGPATFGVWGPGASGPAPVFLGLGVGGLAACAVSLLGLRLSVLGWAVGGGRRFLPAACFGEGGWGRRGAAGGRLGRRGRSDPAWFRSAWAAFSSPEAYLRLRPGSAAHSRDRA